MKRLAISVAAILLASSAQAKTMTSACFTGDGSMLIVAIDNVTGLAAVAIGKREEDAFPGGYFYSQGSGMIVTIPHQGVLAISENYDAVWRGSTAAPSALSCTPFADVGKK